MIAHVETDDGLAIVDLDQDELLDVVVTGSVERERERVELPLVVAADRSGPFQIALVDRRPPLVVSHDAGSTWREAGAGLPPGVDVAISPDHPDVVLYATESRLYLSQDAGRFWRSLTVELPGIRAVAWAG